MVSTRGHPKDLPPPEDAYSPSPSKASSPSKRSKRQTAVDSNSSGGTYDDSLTSTSRPRSRSIVTTTWSHTPSTTTLLWLLISLPLVLWDTGYVLGRPHTMPGGKLHYPLWAPYKIYASVDYFYGFPAMEQGDGFTASQGILNLIETALYLVYLGIVFGYGVHESGTAGRGAVTGWLGRRKVVGREAGLAVLVGWSACVMTVSKTVLYWLNEACSGFQHIGHNDWVTLILVWVIPNGLWIVVPSYIGYVLGAEILQGLEIAAGLPHKKEQ